MKTPTDVAAWFLSSIDREAGDTISSLKLQKLLYYAQAWMLVLHHRPLFDGRIEAWAHGPVVPDVYHAYKQYGWSGIPMPDFVPDFDTDESDLMKQVLDVYGEHSAHKLEHLTHSEAPWKDARSNLPFEARSTTEISHDSMTKFYTDMLEHEGE